jgi:hypothetical protein
MFVRPLSIVTWVSAFIFGSVYAIEDQVVVTGSVLNTTGMKLPLLIAIMGPVPTRGPPQIAYYVTVLSNSGNIRFNIPGALIAVALAILFGINVSIITYLKVVTGKRNTKTMTSLLGVLPSLVSITGCCSGAPLLLLFLGNVTASSIGLVLAPYFSVFAYGSMLSLALNIYYFGSRALRVYNSVACGANGYVDDKGER